MGSKRISYKNLQEIEPGVSLIEQAVESCGNFDYVITTDKPDLMPESLRSKCIERPHYLASDKSDISDAVKHVLSVLHEKEALSKFTDVVVLQPAVVARSHFMLSDMLHKYSKFRCEGAVTVVKTHPWIWSIPKGTTNSFNSWHPGPYPRSQDADDKFVEINSIQIASITTAAAGKRWSLPLMLYELPEWASVFDIDDSGDLHEATKLYPWAKPLLSDWRGEHHVVTSINNPSTIEQKTNNL